MNRDAASGPIHSRDIVRKLAESTGLPPKAIRKIVEGALKELHKVSCLAEKKTAETLMECCWNFGARASFHLGGILEEERVYSNPGGTPWSEFFLRFLPEESKVGGRVVAKWRGRGAPRGGR